MAGKTPRSAVKNTGLRPPWPKGVSGNPRGRPKGALNKATRAAMALLEELGNAVAQGEGGKALAERLVDHPTYRKSLVTRILEGRAAHLEMLLWHYAYGRPVEEVRVRPLQPIQIILQPEEGEEKGNSE